MVADYRALWLRLSKLCRDTGTATFITFTFLNLYLFFTITISIYGLMSQMSQGFGLKDIGLLVNALCNIALLFFICDEAHYASQHVRTNFQKKLLMVELSWMNSDAQTEINMFLRATEMNPSNINCGGFFDVNRNLFKSVRKLRHFHCISSCFCLFRKQKTTTLNILFNICTKKLKKKPEKLNICSCWRQWWHIWWCYCSSKSAYRMMRSFKIAHFSIWREHKATLT